MPPVTVSLRTRDVMAPGLAVLVLAVATLYAVAFDQGLLQLPFTDALLADGGVLHETFHDARHLLGVPCH